MHTAQRTLVTAQGDEEVKQNLLLLKLSNFRRIPQPPTFKTNFFLICRSDRVLYGGGYCCLVDIYIGENFTSSGPGERSAEILGQERSNMLVQEENHIFWGRGGGWWVGLKLGVNEV